MAILVKAYIRQLFGSPEIQVFEFDSKDGGVEDLRQSVSDLVGGRAVQLAWIDQTGDHIQLSNDAHLKLAVSYGVKDSVLRVSAQVDWLGVSSRSATKCSPTSADCQASSDDETVQTPTDSEAAETNTASADGETVAEDAEGEEQVTESGETTAPASAAAEEPSRKSKRKCSRRRCPGESHYTGFVRTVGEDGVAKERKLTEEEAAYLLSRSGSVFDSWRSPLSLSGSLFSHPALEQRCAPTLDFGRPTMSPMFITW